MVISASYRYWSCSMPWTSFAYSHVGECARDRCTIVVRVAQLRGTPGLPCSADVCVGCSLKSSSCIVLEVEMILSVTYMRSLRSSVLEGRALTVLPYCTFLLPCARSYGRNKLSQKAHFHCSIKRLAAYRLYTYIHSPVLHTFLAL